MKKTNLLAFPLFGLFLVNGMAFGTPTTTHWTPATTDIQPFGVLHLGVDNYFTVFQRARDGGSAFGTDIGLTIGVLPFEKLQLEVGIDYIEPTDHPVSFNAKLGTPENALFSGAPALNLGIFNVGTKKDVTNQNIVFGMVGKTIPILGARLFAGPYIGNGKVLVDKNGKRENKGFMIGLDRGFFPAKDKEGNEYKKLVLVADYASGKNAIGGGGVGLIYYFTPNISLLTGPVWFNEKEINGKWKWTIQFDVNLPPVNQWFKK
ncbi:MAG: hypothetical protein N3G78_02805 [Desulfobacterota bacterium]|nr:hypothetical protein [Thermodesulfobacteriota bacterium]